MSITRKIIDIIADYRADLTDEDISNLLAIAHRLKGEEKKEPEPASPKGKYEVRRHLRIQHGHKVMIRKHIRTNPTRKK